MFHKSFIVPFLILGALLFPSLKASALDFDNSIMVGTADLEIQFNGCHGSVRLRGTAYNAVYFR